MFLCVPVFFFHVWFPSWPFLETKDVLISLYFIPCNEFQEIELLGYKVYTFRTIEMAQQAKVFVCCYTSLMVT